MDELRELFINAAKEEARSTAKRAGRKAVKSTVKGAKKAAKRAPSAYNKHMKKELARLKKKHPKTAHTVLFKRAAKSWKAKKKGGKK